MKCPETQSHAKITDLTSYALNKRVLFNFELLGVAVDESDAVHMPASIAHRLYFLGRAYNFPALKMIEPQGRSYLGYASCQKLTGELTQLLSVIRDPVAEHYIRKLLTYLSSRRGETEKGLVVRSL